MPRIEGAIWFVIFTVNIMGRIWNNLCSASNKICGLGYPSNNNPYKCLNDIHRFISMYGNAYILRRQEENGYWFWA